MAYKKTAQEQKLITRQTCSDCAADLYGADKISAAQLETTAEYFVGMIYHRLGLSPGDPLNDKQEQGIIVLGNCLKKATRLAIAGKLEANEVVSNMYLFAAYVYEGVPDATS